MVTHYPLPITQEERCKLQLSATQTLCKYLISNYATGVGWGGRIYQYPPSHIPIFLIRISHETVLPKMSVSLSLNPAFDEASLLRCSFHALRGSEELTEHQQMHLFYVLQTAHLGIILYNDQLDSQFFFLYMFISILYLFRAFKCSSSGDSIVSIRYIVYVTLTVWYAVLDGRSVQTCIPDGHLHRVIHVYFISLHVSSIQVLIIRRFSCINTIYGICHSM